MNMYKHAHTHMYTHAHMHTHTDLHGDEVTYKLLLTLIHVEGLSSLINASSEKNSIGGFVIQAILSSLQIGDAISICYSITSRVRYYQWIKAFDLTHHEESFRERLELIGVKIKRLEMTANGTLQCVG